MWSTKDQESDDSTIVWQVEAPWTGLVPGVVSVSPWRTCWRLSAVTTAVVELAGACSRAQRAGRGLGVECRALCCREGAAGTCTGRSWQRWPVAPTEICSWRAGGGHEAKWRPPSRLELAVLPGVEQALGIAELGRQEVVAVALALGVDCGLRWA